MKILDYYFYMYCCDVYVYKGIFFIILMASYLKKLRRGEDILRRRKILGMVPKDVRSVFDIGCRFNIFKKYKLTTLDIEGDPDILQDLNISQKIPLKDKSVDLVVLNQVLEHLGNPRELISEAKRISKKYLLIGLPNELVYGSRIRYLFGINRWKGFSIYGHKHFFTPKEMHRFVSEEIGRPKKVSHWFCGTGSFLLPSFLKNFLARNFPNIFAAEVYYLIKVR